MGYLLDESTAITPEERKMLRASLQAFNLKHMNASEPVALEFVIRDNLNRVCGGILGYTRWYWLFIDTLWVDEQYRGFGNGKLLLVVHSA